MGKKHLLALFIIFYCLLMLAAFNGFDLDSNPLALFLLLSGPFAWPYAALTTNVPTGLAMWGFFLCRYWMCKTLVRAYTHTTFLFLALLFIYFAYTPEWLMPMNYRETVSKYADTSIGDLRRYVLFAYRYRMEKGEWPYQGGDSLHKVLKPYRNREGGPPGSYELLVEFAAELEPVRIGFHFSYPDTKLQRQHDIALADKMTVQNIDGEDFTEKDKYFFLPILSQDMEGPSS